MFIAGDEKHQPRLSSVWNQWRGGVTLSPVGVKLLCGTVLFSGITSNMAGTCAKVERVQCALIRCPGTAGPGTRQ